MDKRTDKRIKDFISSVAKQNPNLVTVYLFGSYAKGKQKDDSDIDLALIIDRLHDNEKFDMQIQLMLLASDYDIRIEPYPLSIDDFHSSNPLAAEIKRTGIEIKPQTAPTKRETGS
ncbi:MAG: nucleotidyltransferase domain-containing protein [Anditalea sp.]